MQVSLYYGPLWSMTDGSSSNDRALWAKIKTEYFPNKIEVIFGISINGIWNGVCLIAKKHAKMIEMRYTRYVRYWMLERVGNGRIEMEGKIEGFFICGICV